MIELASIALGLAGIALGLAGIGVSIYAIIDNRKQRTQREKAVIGAHKVIERAYAALVHLKPAIDERFRPAIDDTLSAINQQREMLEKL